MISMFYENEIKNVKVIKNTHNVMLNFLYKIKNDSNINDFLKNIYELSSKYQNLERMDKYYFDNNVKDSFEILNYLLLGFREDSIVKDKNGEKIIVPCRVLPDHNGEILIKYISYLPILNLLNERYQYEELIKSRVDLNRKNSFLDVVKNQNNRLFGKGFGTTKFPKDRDLINYKLKNEHIDFREKEYNESRKKEIDDAIFLINQEFNKANEKRDFYISVGCMYWDQQEKDSQSMINVLKNVILSFDKLNPDK